MTGSPMDRETHPNIQGRACATLPTTYLRLRLAVPAFGRPFASRAGAYAGAPFASPAPRQRRAGQRGSGPGQGRAWFYRALFAGTGPKACANQSSNAS